MPDYEELVEEPDGLTEVESDYYRHLEAAVDQANEYISRHAEELERKFEKYEIVEEIIDRFIIYEPMDIIQIDTGYYEGFSIYVVDNYSGNAGMFDDMEAELIEGGLLDVLAEQIVESIKNRVFSEMEDILKDFSYMPLRVLHQGQIEISTGEPQSMNESVSEKDEFIFSDEGYSTLVYIPGEYTDENKDYNKTFNEEIQDHNFAVTQKIEDIADKYGEQMPAVKEILESLIENSKFGGFIMIDDATSGRGLSIFVINANETLKDAEEMMVEKDVPDVVAEQLIAEIEQEIKLELKKFFQNNEPELSVATPTDTRSNLTTIKAMSKNI